MAGKQVTPHPGFDAMMKSKGGGPHVHSSAQGVVPSHSPREGVPKAAGTGAKGGKSGKGG